MSAVMEAHEPSAKNLSALQPPLVQHFELMSTAQGGVAKLRELILTLAVQGKLVPQVSSDEPASKLLQKIRTEKEQLISEGKIKRDKPLAEISDEEKPFSLPNGWEWERFGVIAEIERGGSPRPIQSFLTTEPDGLNWIKIGDTEKGGKYITSAGEKIRREGLSKTRMVFPGDFLLTNSMSFGRPYITQIEGCIHDGWLRIVPPSSLNKDYLYSLLSSRFVRTVFEAAAAGGVVLNLNADKVRTVPIPLPPLAEQARIVTRVEELMRLCDALEIKGQLEAAQHAQLAQTLLGALTASSSPEELADNWQRVTAHFDLLLDRPEAIDALEQTILQLAVRGLLVPQDPKDEPASVLLQKIRAEKDRLIEEGKIKRDKPLADIAKEEKPFELPEGWEWAEALELCSLITDGDHQAPPKANSGIPFLVIGDVRSGFVDLGSASRYVPSSYFEALDWGKKPLLGDVLYTTVGSFGIPVPITQAQDFCFQRHIALFRPGIASIQEFLTLSLGSKFVYAQAEKGATGIAQKTVPLSVLRRLIVPLPPLLEQARIVARVESLRLLCADLRQRLAARQTTQAHLAEALIAEVA